MQGGIHLAYHDRESLRGAGQDQRRSNGSAGRSVTAHTQLGTPVGRVAEGSLRLRRRRVHVAAFGSRRLEDIIVRHVELWRPELTNVGGGGRKPKQAKAKQAGGDALTDAALRPLRFHDLRHTFRYAHDPQPDIRRVQEWMGYADIQQRCVICTTRRELRMRSWSQRRFGLRGRRLVYFPKGMALLCRRVRGCRRGRRGWR